MLDILISWAWQAPEWQVNLVAFVLLAVIVAILWSLRPKGKYTAHTTDESTTIYYDSVV